MKKLTATLLATAFAGLVTGTAHAEPVVKSQQENRDEAMKTMTAAGYQEDFINLITPVAQAVQAEFRIPASVAMSQSILETSWGRSVQTATDKNYFGYKCTNPNSHGTIATGCHEYTTQECNASGCYTTKAYFRVYRSMSDSFRDYGTLIATSGIYDHALPYRDNNPDQFIREVAKRYATDPAYADKNITLMRNYNLYRFNTGTGSSLSGDGKADIARVGDDGKVIAWHNDLGFAQSPYGASAIIATEFTSDNVHFADLDGDGKAEIAKVGDDGNVVAWRNDGGFANTPYGASAIIGTEFTKDNVHFADLDGDGKAEIAKVGDDGKVVAWHNDGGFANTPYGASAIIATDFTRDNVHFGDLDGDRKAEIARVGTDGKVVAWHNDLGFANTPYGASAIIATDFTNDNLQLV